MAKSTTDKQPTALELFELYQPRFREVQWAVNGFHKHTGSCRFYFQPTRTGEYQWYDPCYLNVNENGLDLSFRFDPASEQGPREQLQTATWEAILSGPFANRPFWADPAREVVQTLLRPCVARLYRDLKIPIKFSYEGDPIQGLCLQENMSATCWHFFVPADSREGMAIANALGLERAQAEEASRRSAGPIDFDKLRYDLDVSLAAVPAQ